MDRLSVTTLNQLDAAGFAAALEGIFEGSPWVVQAAAGRRPFADRAALLAACAAVVGAADREQQLALIRAHPDLAGRAALAGTLTRESAGEQASAGLDRLDPAEFARFHALNQAYRERFAFPFVICVRRQTKQSILAAFEQRLTHDAADEIATALAEIVAIADIRLAERIAP